MLIPEGVLPEAPESLTVNFVFPSPHPFSEGQFEEILRGMGSKLGRGSATSLLGAETEAIGGEYQGSLVLYTPQTGHLGFYKLKPESSIELVQAIQGGLLAAAKLTQDDVRSVELDAVYLLDLRPTAMAALREHRPGPKWLSELFNHELQEMGLRWASKEATTWTDSYRTLTPWYQVLVEPFVDNPRKLFLRIIVREKNWEMLKPHLASLQNRAATIFSEVVKHGD